MSKNLLVALLIPTLIFLLVHTVRVAEVATVRVRAGSLVAFKSALMAQICRTSSVKRSHQAVSRVDLQQSQLSQYRFLHARLRVL
jgi:hypothetical protein